MSNITEKPTQQKKKKIPPRKPPRLNIKGKPCSERAPQHCKEGVVSPRNGIASNKDGGPRPTCRAEMRGSHADYEEIDCAINALNCRGNHKGVRVAEADQERGTWSNHVYESICDDITPTRSTSCQTEACTGSCGDAELVEHGDYFNNFHQMKRGDMKVFRESSCQTQDDDNEHRSSLNDDEVVGLDELRRTMKRYNDDEELYNIKESRFSSLSSNSTQDSVDSGHFSARHPERSPTSPEDDVITSLWQPEGLSPEEIKSFMESLPPGKIPRTGSSEEMAYFKSQLLYQNPEQDGDPTLCKSLTTKEQSVGLKNIWLDCVKSRGTGYIAFAENCKKSCKSCGEFFSAKEVMVVSRDGARHPSCFTCTVCQELLSKLIYYNDTSGRLYCGRHFAELFKPRCFKCDELVISGTITKAMGHSWHEDHFCCVKCDEKIKANKYTTTENDEPLCLKCHTLYLADVCTRCKEKITVGQKKITHDDEHWHDECFSCQKCHSVLSVGRFNVKDGKLLCEKCSVQNNQKSKLCYKCGDEIKPGSQLFEHNKNYYHAACFSCEFCNERITSGFMENDGWFYCPECFHRLFSEKCVRCGLPVASDGVTYNDEIWHNSCFDCFYCHQPIASQRFLLRFGNRYCNGCYQKMFAKECHSCHELIKDTAYLTTNDMFWHNHCFQCSSCHTDLQNIGFHMMKDKIYCSQCPE